MCQSKWSKFMKQTQMCHVYCCIFIRRIGDFKSESFIQWTWPITLLQLVHHFLLYIELIFVTVYVHQDHFKHAKHIKSWWPNLIKTDHMFITWKSKYIMGKYWLHSFVKFNEFYHECIRWHLQTSAWEFKTN